MSSQNPTIKLPPERVAQLKAIAAALDLPSVADTVGFLIRAEIKRGTIPASIPGFEIAPSRGKVRIAFDGGHPTLVSKDAARRFAKTITDVLDGEPSMVSMDDDFAVIRQGTGIRLSIPMTAQGKVMARDVARDVAALIERAAK